MIQWTLKQARRLIVAVIGGTVLIAGLIMTVTPGPALLVIPLAGDTGHGVHLGP